MPETRLVSAWRRFSIHPLVRPFTERRIYLQWHLAGRPVPPPPLVKQAIVRRHLHRFGLRTFVETGTFAGEMTNAMRGHAARIVSIELGDQWYARAVERFRGCPDVELLHGDSGTRLAEVLTTLGEPALFWLDAHYSGSLTARGLLDSPILPELDAIRAHPVRGHVVLIDDLRDFNGENGYPQAAELVAWLRQADPGARVEIRDDILRWLPAPRDAR
jgi:hypothetical protein